MKPLIRHKRAISLSVVAFTLVCFGLWSSMQAVTPASDRGYDTTAKTSGQARALTFAQRVAFQRAIEEVYWRHRIWSKENPDPKPSLDAVMSRAQLEQKVEDYLRNSQVLENHWQRPITADQLQAEMDRMAQHTKQPEVLRELFQALGNDPSVIAECLARPALADLLVTTPYADDQTIHGVKRRAQSDVQTFNYTLPTISDEVSGCSDDNWRATTTVGAPLARIFHTAVWTGAEMIVWGGEAGDGLNTGGRYNPSTDSWRAVSTTNAPEAREAHSAVWTGAEMIVWGGGFIIPWPIGGVIYFNTGGRYNPNTDSWTATSTTNAPVARWFHTAVWTGSEMIIWGGNQVNDLNSGGRYNPSTDSWTATSITNAPEARSQYTAVWTGSEMIIWGGDNGNGRLNTGGRYDPDINGWTATGTTNAPSARMWHTAVWTGGEMIVWGGSGGAVV